MHDDIRKFAYTGIIGDANIVASKDFLVKHLEDNLRDTGYVPVLDMDPQFTLQYDAEHDHYTFALSVYGVHVGEDKSWDIAGMMTGKPIMKYIPTPKSKQS